MSDEHNRPVTYDTDFTFEQAQRHFRTLRSAETVANYVDCALKAWRCNNIIDATLGEALEEAGRWLQGMRIG
jgi:hypothetical protein